MTGKELQPSPYCRCGARLAVRDPPGGFTPEQRWCGIWYDHPPPEASGSLVGHIVTALVPSAELLAAQQRKTR